MNNPNTRQQLSLSVKEQARRLGFDDCRIASALDEADDGFDAWLDRGQHADMAWLERTRAMRQQVALKLPGAQSVVVLASYYYRHDVRPAPTARIARYAWRRDYHRALAKPLKALAAHIQACCPGADCYASTDSGPVRERAWAARAGLGWVGRHGLVIHPRMGSWINLATIITTAPLDADTAMANRCGACDACVRACPTQAIGDKRLVDARRCIAYHTIENKGDLPEDITGSLNGWVFGCDSCQEVCPWNQPDRLNEDADTPVHDAFSALSADQLAAMTEEEFIARFAGTPVMRAKCAGMQRNAAAVLQGL